MLKFVKEIAQSYAEEGQALPYRMILCRREADAAIALHDWIKCRDFVAEAIFSELCGSAKSIYSFGWGAHIEEKPLTNSDALYCAVKGDLETLAANLPLLRDFETKVGLEPTDLTPTDVPDVNILVSDKGWMVSPTLLNLYTLITKCLMFKGLPEATSLEEYVTNITNSTEKSFAREAAYWNTILKPFGFAGVEYIVEKRDTLFNVDWVSHKDVSTTGLHHGHGPVSFFTACTWVQKGSTDPECCDVIKSSVLSLCDGMKNAA